MFFFHIYLLFHLIIICKSEEFIYIEPNQCNQNEYFNLAKFKCSPCNSTRHLIPSSEKLNCICDKKSKIKTYYGPDGMPECIPCQLGQIPTQDQKECIPCSRDNGTCVSCVSNAILNRDKNGTLFPQQQCIHCINGTRPSGGKCISCPSDDMIPEERPSEKDPPCPCPSKSKWLGGICVPNDILTLWPDESIVYQANFDNIKVDSKLYRNHLHSSIYFCKKGNQKACQRAANLCVLSMYHIDRNENSDPSSISRRSNGEESRKGSPCLIFRNNPSTSTGAPPLPWIFYGEEDAPSVLNRNKIPTKYSMDSKSTKSRLNITATVYSVTGDYLGIRSGEDLFSLCPLSPLHTKHDGFRFGTPYHRKCHIALNHALQQQKTTLMFDPYLAFEQGGDIHLYALPILITNLKVNGGDMWQWQLTRRLMLIDISSGVSSTSLGSTPQAIRYLQSLTIRVNLRDSKGFIFPPLLIARYATIVLTANIEETYLNTELKVEYSIPGDNTAYAIEVSIGVLSALSSLAGCLQAWSQARRDGRTSAGIDLITLVHVAIHASGHLANSFFIVAAATCMHSCLFFKGQAVPKCLLPKENIERILRDYLCVAFSLKLLQISYLVFHQCTVDMFLLDWERPSRSPRDNSGDRSISISVWRTYLVGNEWTERQSMRRVPPVVHLIASLAILELIGLKSWAAAWPELNSPLDTPPSSVCRLTLGIIVVCFCYLLQWLWVILIHERFIKHPMTELVDLCSLTNISLFILVHRRHGYYVHGRSAHGSADTDAKQLATRLDAEAADVCAGRGLVPGHPNQTFELAVPALLRGYYDKLMSAATCSAETNKTRAQNVSHTIHQTHSANASQTVNRFLAAFLDHALTDLDYEVREKKFLETLLDVEFADVIDNAILYTDNGHSFDKVLFFGQELTIFTFELFLFSFIEILSQNYLLAILLTGLCDKILGAIRYFGGRHNIAKKTLIDPRFLI